MRLHASAAPGPRGHLLPKLLGSFCSRTCGRSRRGCSCSCCSWACVCCFSCFCASSRSLASRTQAAATAQASAGSSPGCRKAHRAPRARRRWRAPRGLTSRGSTRCCASASTSSRASSPARRPAPTAPCYQIALEAETGTEKRATVLLRGRKRLGGREEQESWREGRPWEAVEPPRPRCEAL